MRPPVTRTIPGPNLKALSEVENRAHFVFAGCPQGNVDQSDAEG